MEEIWKDIPDWEGMYQASNLGNIKSLSREYMNRGRICSLKGRILKFTKQSNGYLQVGLHIEGTKYNYLVHRLVLEAFTSNPNNYPQCNHKDGVKTNNYASNLEWCTPSENVKHSYEELDRVGPLTGKCGKLHHRSKPVAQYSLTGKLIKTWESINLAEQGTGTRGNIWKSCNNKQRTAGGYKWEYA